MLPLTPQSDRTYIESLGGACFVLYSAQCRSCGRPDPFVIALAMERGMTVIIEDGTGGPKWPQDVCQAEGVECKPLLGLLDAEDWVL